jgi:CsoR family transcriptional regulator, copper-sensing transcriptional repressor
MPREPAGSKEDLTKRLRRIEGQVRGVAKMVEEDRGCLELIQQLAAIRAATHQVSLLIVRSYASQCLTEPLEGDEQQAAVEDLITALSKTA